MPAAIASNRISPLEITGFEFFVMANKSVENRIKTKLVIAFHRFLKVFPVLLVVQPVY